jgi:hypothetical protein
LGWFALPNQTKFSHIQPYSKVVVRGAGSKVTGAKKTLVFVKRVLAPSAYIC